MKVIRQARLEILQNFWRKTLNKIEFNCGKKDQKTREIIRKIIIVPPKVQREALLYYSHQCAKLHSLAFF